MSDKRQWIKLDVGYLDNPKINELMDEHPHAIILHLFCIAYAKQHRTNGRVPMRQALRRACAEHADLQRCIDLGILRMDGDAHLVVHDYTKHQGTAEDDAKVAEMASRRAKKAAEARWSNAPEHAPEHASKDASGVLNECSTDAEKRREEKRRDTSPDGDAEFDQWWEHYPRKVSKGQARKAYRTAAKKTDHAVLAAAVVEFATKVQGSDPKFIPHPATWLNGEKWDDQEAPSNPSIRTTATGEQWDLGEWV